MHQQPVDVHMRLLTPPLSATAGYASRRRPRRALGPGEGVFRVHITYPPSVQENPPQERILDFRIHCNVGAQTSLGEYVVSVEE